MGINNLVKESNQQPKNSLAVLVLHLAVSAAFCLATYYGMKAFTSYYMPEKAETGIEARIDIGQSPDGGISPYNLNSSDLKDKWW